MTSAWLVARRELVTRARSKSFLIGLAVTVLLVVGLAAVPRLFAGDDAPQVALVGAESQKLAPVLTEQARRDGVELEMTTPADEDAARAALTDGELDAAVVGGDTVLVDDGLNPALEQLLDGAYRTVATQQRLVDAGLDPQQVSDALSVPPLRQVSVGDAVADGATRLVAVVVVLVMFMLIYTPAIYVAMGVVEEKSSRIVELLLATLRPTQLLAGKVVGIGLLAFVQLAVIAVAGLGAVWLTDVSLTLPAGIGGVVAAAFLWFLLGYAFFATLAAAASSLVSRQEDVNGVLTPVMLLMMAAYLVGFVAVFNPGSLVAHVVSIVPPFSAVVMPVRTATTVVPWWEVLIAIGLMLVATAGVLALGARVYRRAVLRTGARIKVREVLRPRSAPAADG